MRVKPSTLVLWIIVKGRILLSLTIRLFGNYPDKINCECIACSRTHIRSGKNYSVQSNTSIHNPIRSSATMANNLAKHMRHCALFLYDKNTRISAREMATDLESVYGAYAPKKSTCMDWLEKLRSGNWNVDNLEDLPGRGRRSHVDDERLKALVEEDPKMTCRELSTLLNRSVCTIHEHLKLVGKVNKRGRWVPHRLTDKNKQDRVRIATDLLNRYREGSLKLDNIVTCDEKWVLYENPVRQNQWVDRGALPSGTPKANLHPRKIMLCVWWSTEGIVHWELLLRGETITAESYCEQLDRVAEAMKEMRPQGGPVEFLQDNARPHVARLTKQKLESLGWNVLSHPILLTWPQATFDYFSPCPIRYARKSSRLTRTWLASSRNSSKKSLVDFSSRGSRICRIAGSR